MNELIKLNKLFEDNAILNNEELNTLIFSINGIIDYLTDPVNGLEERLNNIRSAISLIPTLTENIIIREEVGLSGISTLLAFTGASNLEEAVSKLDFKSIKYPPDNYSESSNVQINPGEILFMTTAKGREIGGGSYSWITNSSGDIWSTPVLIGSNTTSTTGVDTNEFNYIYCRTKKSVDASGFYPLSGLLNLELEQLGILEWIESHQNGGSKFSNHYVNHYDNIDFENNTPENIDLINGLWVDHPYGISTEFPHEWMIGYHMVDGQWKYYFGPVMISNYGYNGLDGDGVEYIFFASKEGLRPTNDPTQWTDDPDFLNDDYIRRGSGWQDEPIDLYGENYGLGSIEWISTRKKRRLNVLIENLEWGAFSTPKIWSRLGIDGKGGYTIDFTNENMPVGTDSEGNVQDYSNSGQVNVYFNGTPVNNSNFDITTGTIVDSEGNSIENNTVTVTLNGSIITVNISNLTNFKSKNIYIPISVRIPNESPRYFYITLYGVPTGEPGTSIDIYSSANTIRTDENGNNPVPRNLGVGVKVGKGSNYLKLTNLTDTNYSIEYSYDNDTQTIQLPKNQNQIELASNKLSITLILKYNDNEIDSETIPYIKDGVNGRGVTNITKYYKAFSEKAQTFNENSNPTAADEEEDDGIISHWYLSTQSTTWGEDNPYLYSQLKITYTNEISWESPQLEKVWNENSQGLPGEMGYTLIVEPSYAIIEEYVDDNDLTAYTPWLGRIELKQGNETIPLTLIDDNYSAVTISSDYSEITDYWGKYQISYSNDNKILLEISEIEDKVSPKPKTGEMSLNVGYIDENDDLKFYLSIKIPVYINRLGTFSREIKHGVETAKGELITAIVGEGEGDRINKLLNWSELVSSAVGTVSSFNTRINNIETANSEISQTAKLISMSVNSGWMNYIVNPLAINSRIDTINENNGYTESLISTDELKRTYYILDDYVFGKVVLIWNKDANAGGWPIYLNLNSNYGDLTGKWVTYFCVISNDLSTNGDLLHFGTGYYGADPNYFPHKAIKMLINNNELEVSPGFADSEYYLDKTSGKFELNNNWYLCWTTVKLAEGRSVCPDDTNSLEYPPYFTGFNNVRGKWKIYYSGIVEGKGCPSIEMIKQGAELKKAGIDLSNGTITLDAENTIIKNNLSIDSLRTSGGGSIVNIKEGTAEFIGINGIVNIRLGIDENGCAVLKFYDKDGNFKYDLGPEGIISNLGNKDSSFIDSIYAAYSNNILTSNYYGGTTNNLASELSLTQYYRFIEGYVYEGNVRKYKISLEKTPSNPSNPSVYDNKVYNSNLFSNEYNGNLPDGSMISSGYYLCGQKQENNNGIYSRSVYYVYNEGAIPDYRGEIYYKISTGNKCTLCTLDGTKKYTQNNNYRIIDYINGNDPTNVRPRD